MEKSILGIAALSLAVVAWANASAQGSERFLTCSSEYQVIGSELVTVEGPGLIAPVKQGREGWLAGGQVKSTAHGPGYLATYSGLSGKVHVAITTAQLQQARITAFISDTVTAELMFTITANVSAAPEITNMKVMCGLKKAG